MQKSKKLSKPSCERNSAPIYDAIAKHLTDAKCLIEIASGNGQHAVSMAPKMPHLTWITSGPVQNHAQIKLWLNEADIDNIEGPCPFQVGLDNFPTLQADALFTSNSFHIMPWEVVVELIKQASENLIGRSLFIVYGPFSYNGEFTSKSNEEFHHILRQNASHQGIRDFKDVHEQFQKRGFAFVDDIAMPANNQILIYKKQESK